MDKRYSIVITESCVEDVIGGNDWEEGAGKGQEKYGYTPEIIKKEQVVREIYRQNTEILELVDVIKAINGI